MIKEKAILKPARIKKQIVAGFVVFRRTLEGIKYLLLYRRGSYWNFPKGHFEMGEKGLDTALRETKEETGLQKSDLRIIYGFRSNVRFHFKKGSQVIHDKLILYLAETRNPRIVISPREHSGFAWFLYRDALAMIGSKYSGTRRVLKEANDFLHKKSFGRREANPQRKNPDVQGSGAPSGKQ